VRTNIRAILRSPLFYGIAYLSVIPIYALAYYYLLDVKATGKLGFIDSFYFSVVTITTLGYGDILPQSDWAKMVVASESIIGISIIGLFLNSVAQRAYFKQTVALEERIVGLIDTLIHSHTAIIEGATIRRIPQPEIRFSVLSEDRIRENLKDVYYKMPMPSAIGTVGERVTYSVQNIFESIDNLLVHVEYLPPELIHIISMVESDQGLKRWLREYNKEPENTPYGVFSVHDRDISSYSKALHNLHLFYHELKEFNEATYCHKPQVRYRVLADAIVHNREYKKGLFHAKYIRNNKEYAKDVCFLSIIAYLKLGKVKKAKSALFTYVENGYGSVDYVKENIVNHYTGVSKEELKSLLE